MAAAAGSPDPQDGKDGKKKKNKCLSCKKKVGLTGKLIIHPNIYMYKGCAYICMYAHCMQIKQLFDQYRYGAIFFNLHIFK